MVTDRGVIRHLGEQVRGDREEPLPVGLVGALQHHVSGHRDEVEPFAEHVIDQPAMRRVTASHLRELLHRLLEDVSRRLDVPQA